MVAQRSERGLGSAAGTPPKAEGPMVAVLSSYHGERGRIFTASGPIFESTNARLIHPPAWQLIEPDQKGFVLREGDPGIPHDELQKNELVNMLRLRREPRGHGFGYVLSEDGYVGQHTAGEMAWLALAGVPLVASRPITRLNQVPRYAESALRRSVQTGLPLAQVTSESLEAITADLARQEQPAFTGKDQRGLIRLVQRALLEQRHEDRLVNAAVSSSNAIKTDVLREVVGSQYSSDHLILVDNIPTSAPNVPEQPFMEQGIDGAHGRQQQARAAGSGLSYKGGIGSFENFLVAFDPETYDPNAWATPDRWASDSEVYMHPERLVYADAACVVYTNQGGKTVTAFSRPVEVPTDAAMTAISSGGDTLYAKVLQDRLPKIDLHDPHSSLTGGRYTRRQQLTEVTEHALELAQS